MEPCPDGGYDYYYVYYVYVFHPIDLSGTEVIEKTSPWTYTLINNYDFNFSKPGWYKICGPSDHPINVNKDIIQVYK
jgi:hypothetical protein